MSQNMVISFNIRHNKMINACLTAQVLQNMLLDSEVLTVVFVPKALLVMQNVQQLNSIPCIYIELLTQLHCTQQEQGAIRQAYM